MKSYRIVIPISIFCISILGMVFVIPTGVGGETSTNPGLVAQTESVDYRINSISKLDYLNSRGFEDSNNDGKITIQIDKKLNMSNSRDPTLTFDANKPIVLKGSGGFTNIPAPLISKIPSEHSLTVDSLQFTDAHGGGPHKKIIHVGGSVTLRDVVIKNTVHMASYPGETFKEKHRVGGVRAAEALTIHDSTIKTVAQAASTGGKLRITSSMFKNISSTLQGGVQSGSKAEISDTVFIDSSATRGGAIKANSATLDNVTLQKVDAGFGGGGIKTEGGLKIADSEIRDANARRNGGAINAGGNVKLRDSIISNAESGQGYSIYANGLHSLTVENSKIRNADPILFGSRGVTEGSISISDSNLQDVNKLQASKITIDNSDINESLSLKGLYFTIRESKLYNIGGMDGLEISLSDSIIRGSGKLAGGDSVTVKDSYLLEFPGFRTESLTLSNTTFYKSGDNVILSPNRRSLTKVNFIEASTPVFDGKLPDRSDVFIDTNEDTESYGQWDADLYWSRNETFPAANKLPVTIDTAAIAKDQLDLQVSQSRVKAGEDAIVEYNITNTAAQSIQSPSIHMGSVPKKLQLKRITSTDGTFDSSNKTLRYEQIGSGETKTGSIVLSRTKDTAGNYTFTIEGKLSNSVVDTATTTVQVDEPRQQSQKNDTTDDTSSGNEKKQQRRQAYDILLGFNGVEFVNENTVKANVYVKNRADNRLNNPTIKITPPDGMQITDPIGGQTVSGEKAHEWTLSAIEPSEQRELTITMEQTNGELSSDAEITAEVMLLDESVVSTTAEYRRSEEFLSSDLPLSGDSTPGFGFLPAICGLVTVLAVIRAVRL